MRYWISHVAVAAMTRAILRVRLEGRDRLPSGAAIYCFNHLSWVDPFVLMAVLPFRPRLFFFGPKEEDMDRGGRNRLMTWTGTTIPYKPGKDDLLWATRRVGAVLEGGGIVAIAGEGRIHARESTLLPLNEGTAYFALRSRVPIVPLAIRGSSWLRFGGRVTVQVGEPLPAAERPSREAVDTLTRRAWRALKDMVRDAPDLEPPGRLGRWFSDVFNDWPEGSRSATLAAEAELEPPEVELEPPGGPVADPPSDTSAVPSG